MKKIWYTHFMYMRLQKQVIQHLLAALVLLQAASVKTVKSCHIETVITLFECHFNRGVGHRKYGTGSTFLGRRCLNYHGIDYCMT